MNRLLCGVTLLMFCSAGCGGGAKDRPQLGQVAGTARYQSQPIANATVTFYPEKGPPGIGRTDEQGEFQIKTNGQLGAVVGKNKVTLVAADESQAIPPSDGGAIKFARKNTLPKKYSDPAQTDLVVEVPAEGDGGLLLDLTD